MLKKLERTWKKLCLAFICGLLRVTSRPPAPLDWRTRPCRILFLRPDRLGDAILTTGVFRAIATASPYITLDALGSPRNAPILRRVPHLSSVPVLDRRSPWGTLKLVRQLRAASYDGVIDCMVTAPSMTCLLLMLASGARHRIGIAGRGVDSALTIRVPPARDGVHLVDLLAAFTSVFDINPTTTDVRPQLELTRTELETAESIWERNSGGARLRVLVNVSAGKPARNWPEDRFASAIGYLREKYRDSGVIVIGAPSEWERVARIAALAGEVAVATPRIDDVMGLVATANFVLTPDTSVAHLATAFRTPAVAMYLVGTAKLWSLYHSRGASIESDDGSLTSLPLDRALRALDQVMEPVAAGAA